MNLIVFKNPPVNPDDLKLIQQMMKDNDVLVGAGIAQEALYNPAYYFLFQKKDSGEVRVLLDRNCLTRLVDIARGDEINSTDFLYKLVSAAMSFFIFTGVIIEPNLAIYEYGFSKNHPEAKDDLINFRVADHIHPQKFADIAVGRALSVNCNELEVAKSYLVNFPETREKDFSKQLSVWKLSYLFVLKIAQLKKSKTLTAEEQVKAFLKWMEEETLFNAVASVFAFLYLSPNPPEKKMIKGIESSDILKLYQGIQNTAWDLAYLTHWGECVRQSPTNITWLLFSNDKAMKLIAKSLFVAKKQDEEISLINLLSICWKPSSANNMAKTIINYSAMGQRKKVQRNEILKKRFSKFPDMIRELEIDLNLPVNTI